MRLLATVLVLAAARAHAQPADPIFIAENWHRADVTGHVKWTPVVADRVLDHDDFLDLTGEHALAESNRHRRVATIVLAVGGSMGFVATTWSAVTRHDVTTWAIGGASVAMLGGAIYEAMSMRYLTVGEARALAARYNTTHVAPYVVPSGAGVTLGRSF